MDLQSIFQRAILFAAERHGDQKMPGSEASYLVHLSNVAMEVIFAAGQTRDFDLKFAVQVALLHDVLEDTPSEYPEIEHAFGPKIAKSVLALTKDESLPEALQIPDSLNRIKRQPREVWAVKLADRISNMQEPPDTWSMEKRRSYQEMAGFILIELKGGNTYLEHRLAQKIKDYERFLK